MLVRLRLGTIHPSGGDDVTDYDRSTVSYSGAMLMMQERRRQLDELSYSAEHDDRHDCGELILAAACYQQHAFGIISETLVNIIEETYEDGVPLGWPWDGVHWKPSDDPIRNLIKAGALIAAEIDRLKRAASP
jgi:hypothetical protein